MVRIGYLNKDIINILNNLLEGERLNGVMAADILGEMGSKAKNSVKALEKVIKGKNEYMGL